MRYVKVVNNIPINYSIEQLLEEHPGAIIYKNSQMPNEQLLSNYDVYPLITTSPPNTLDDESVKEGIPELNNGEWHQTWLIRKLTAEEIDQILSSSVGDSEDNLHSSDNDFFVNKNTSNGRYEICQICPSFTILKTCKECGCIMPLKVRLKASVCPLGKW